LSEDNKNRRRDTALTLLSKFREKDFLHKIITGDEKWILYDNPKRRKSCVDPSQSSTFDAKAQYPRQGFTLCLVGLERCVILRMLLQPGETITADRYQEKLTNWSIRREKAIYWPRTSYSDFAS